MKLLALDTSSIACSVALQLDGTIIERHEEQPREHTRILMPMIQSVFDEAGTTLSELDAIVLGNGPGSFIGMRIGASVAQGLAFGSGLKIVPVSSLAAVAAQVFEEDDAAEVVVTQDAHMQEVYLGIYRRDADGMPAEVMAEQLHGLGVISQCSESDEKSRVAAGFGWQRYPEILAANTRYFAAVADVLYPTARHLLPLGSAGFAQDRAVDPRDVEPAYLRQKVAEIPVQEPH